VERTEDTSFPGWDGYRDMNELLDKPMVILSRESRAKKDGTGNYELWLVEVIGEGTGLTIPRGNLGTRHVRWTMERHNLNDDGTVKARKVVISGQETSTGYMVYKIMNWNEDDERLWEKMGSGDNVPF
jgi:hypothetical protein